MGTVISSKARIETIEEHVKAAASAAAARTGAVAESAVTWLVPAVQAMERAVGPRNDAREAERTARAVLMAADAKVTLGIAGIRDEMWQALGRPRRSAQLDQIFPDGVSTYTREEPRRELMLLGILRGRILSATSPAWTAEQRAAWAAEVEAFRSSLTAPLAAYEPVQAEAAIADATHRNLARTAALGLQAFKRDLRNRGLSETQIHDIIPDASVRQRTPAPQPQPGTHPVTGTTPTVAGTPANDGAAPPATALRRAS